MFKLGRSRTTPFWQTLLEGAPHDAAAWLEQSPELSQEPVPARLSRRFDAVTAGARPLHIAAGRGEAELVRMLVKLGGSVEAVDDAGQTPLHAAAQAGQDEIVKLLLRRQASVTATDAQGQTPLHAAGRSGCDAGALALIDAGADVHEPDATGNTPLHWAVAGGCERTVQQLLEARVAINGTNDRGRTPLHVAVISEDHSVYSHIDPDRLDARHCTERIAEQLLEHGADANAVDGTGCTALDLFEFLEGDRETDPLVQQLKAHGGQWFRYQHRHNDDASSASHFGTHHGAPAPPTAQPQQGAALERELAGEPIILSNRSVLIGRSRECDVRYKSRTLSRHHACIRPEGERYIIQDEGSRNGIVINGEKVGQSHALKSGDVISLGVYEFAFDGQQLLPLTGELDEHELASEAPR
jgi:hypothetical protein